MAYPIGAVAVDVVFFPLNKVDNICLFHPVRVNAHVFGHSLNLLKFHAPSFVSVWSQAFLEAILTILIRSAYEAKPEKADPDVFVHLWRRQPGSFHDAGSTHVDPWAIEWHC